jgi:hypothetical protein
MKLRFVLAIAATLIAGGTLAACDTTPKQTGICVDSADRQVSNDQCTPTVPGLTGHWVLVDQ